MAREQPYHIQVEGAWVLPEKVDKVFHVSDYVVDSNSESQKTSALFHEMFSSI